MVANCASSCWCMVMTLRVVDSLVPQVHSDGELVLPGVEFFEGDLRDADLLDRALTASTACSISQPKSAWARACTKSYAMSAATTSRPRSLLERLATPSGTSARRGVVDERVWRRPLPST